MRNCCDLRRPFQCSYKQKVQLRELIVFRDIPGFLNISVKEKGLSGDGLSFLHGKIYLKHWVDIQKLIIVVYVEIVCCVIPKTNLRRLEMKTHMSFFSI